MPFAGCFFFGKHMHNPNNKRCQTKSSSIKMRDQDITKTRSLRNNSMREKALPQSLTFQKEKRNHYQYRR